jgi:hypothetical protein
MSVLSLSVSSLRFRLYALWIVIGLALVAAMIYVFVPSSEGDAVDIDKIGRRFCNNESLDPDDLARLKDHLFNTEQIDFQDITEMQEYLCGNCKDCFFPDNDASFLKWFGVSKKRFHDKIKKRILNDLQNSSGRIRKFLKKSNNPDIGINKNTGRIMLKSRRDTKEILETNLLLKNFLP